MLYFIKIREFLKVLCHNKKLICVVFHETIHIKSYCEIGGWYFILMSNNVQNTCLVC